MSSGAMPSWGPERLDEVADQQRDVGAAPRAAAATLTRITASR
jgi:hypothetical protein